MDSQELRAINLKMLKIEYRYPNKYRDNKTWKLLFVKREHLTYKLMVTDLSYQKQKLDRLIGFEREECEKLIRQYENYLSKHTLGVNNGIQ